MDQYGGGDDGVKKKLLKSLLISFIQIKKHLQPQLQ